MGFKRTDERNLYLFGIDGVTTIGPKHEDSYPLHPTIIKGIPEGLVEAILENCDDDARYNLEFDGEERQGIIDGIKYMDVRLQHQITLSYQEFIGNGRPQSIRRKLIYEVLKRFPKTN